MDMICRFHVDILLISGSGFGQIFLATELHFAMVHAKAVIGLRLSKRCAN
jgi:hypothetical protein